VIAKQLLELRNYCPSTTVRSCTRDGGAPSSSISSTQESACIKWAIWPPIKIIVTSGRELVTEDDSPEGGRLPNPTTRLRFVRRCENILGPVFHGQSDRIASCTHDIALVRCLLPIVVGCFRCIVIPADRNAAGIGLAPDGVNSIG
jgi:hypothetical protein